MSSKLAYFFIALFFVLAPSLAVPRSRSSSPMPRSRSSSPVPRSRASTPNSICNFTPHPAFCRSVFPGSKPGNVHDYGRSSVRQSLAAASNVHSLVNRHLRSRSRLSKSDVLALEDCDFLSALNVEFLSSTVNSISSTDSLSDDEASQVDAWMSAIMTNLQTCSDGLQILPSASSVTTKLSPYFTNNTMLYSVALALFTRGWVPPHRGPRKLIQRETLFPARKMGVTHVLTWPQSGSRRQLLQVDIGMNVTVNGIVVVNPDGSGNFTTVNAALAAAPNNTKAGNGYFVIYVVAGVYEEYITVASNKKYLMMVGDGINKTIITGNHSVVDGWTTFKSATFAVTATGFVAVNMTFRNTAGAIKHQAVALRNGADLSAFYKCSFEGYQDTLYTHSLRQFYKECDIYGTVDFIFGNSAVVFQDCNLYPRQPLHGQFNAITAQGRTDPNQNTGTSIHNCKIRAADDLASSNFTVKTYLGRPWKEYSRTVYMQSFMDSLIDPAGWHEWSGDFALNTSYYAEYSNTGLGSNTTNRVTWPGYHVINATDAINFIVTNFILGDFWLPSTGVPYFGGLL